MKLKGINPNFSDLSRRYGSNRKTVKKIWDNDNKPKRKAFILASTPCRRRKTALTQGIHTSQMGLKKDPEYSIECGVQELKTAIISAEVEKTIDMEHIKLALKGYNFGNGYISWAKANYGAIPKSIRWSFPPYGRAFTSGGNQAIVEVALTQLGNEGGHPYWSWYGFDGCVEWCACFVSWVPTNADILTVDLSRNSQAAWTVQTGLKVMDNGKTEAMSSRQVILSFLIGKAMEKPTM